LLAGHIIDGISELPLVVSDKIQEYNKTKQAVLFLRRNKLWGDVLKVSNSYHVIIICDSNLPGVSYGFIRLKLRLKLL
jgi:hypothetical protein